MKNIFYNNNLYIDFHTHRIRRGDRNDIIEIISLHLGKETFYKWFTIGKHPWWTDTVLSEFEKQSLTNLINTNTCLAMGEMGLDKLKGPSMETQIEVFKSQLNLAEKLQKPVIIHCVRAFDKLIKIKKDYPKIKNWCIHGFSRHAELANQLIAQGFYISLMPVKNITQKYIDLITSIPSEKFFLETDSMPNTKIEDIYLQVADIKNISVTDLKVQLINNAKDFFNE